MNSKFILILKKCAQNCLMSVAWVGLATPVTSFSVHKEHKWRQWGSEHHDSATLARFQGLCPLGHVTPSCMTMLPCQNTVRGAYKTEFPSQWIFFSSYPHIHFKSRLHTSGKTRSIYLPFLVWLISLNLMISSCIHFPGNATISFSLHGYIKLHFMLFDIFFIGSSVDTHPGWSLSLTIMNNAAINKDICKHHCGILNYHPVGVCPGTLHKFYFQIFFKEPPYWLPLFYMDK